MDSIKNRYISPAEVVVPEVETVRAPVGPAEAGVSPNINSQESVSDPWSPSTDTSIEAINNTIRQVGHTMQPVLLSPLSQSPGSPMSVGDLAVSTDSKATTVETR